MKETLSVHHIALVTRDLDRFRRFYEGVLGLEVLRSLDDEAGKPRALWLGLGIHAFLAIELAALSPPELASREFDVAKDDRAPGFHCVALSIDHKERESFRKRLESAGFPIVRETAFTIYTRDPDGALVGLSHYPEPALANSC